MNTTTATHQHDNRCLDLFKKLSEYIDQELDEVTCKQIEHHLENCSPCRACLETLKTTAGLCRRIEEASVPISLSNRLKKMIFELTY